MSNFISVSEDDDIVVNLDLVTQMDFKPAWVNYNKKDMPAILTFWFISTTDSRVHHYQVVGDFATQLWEELLIAKLR